MGQPLLVIVAADSIVSFGACQDPSNRLQSLDTERVKAKLMLVELIIPHLGGGVFGCHIFSHHPEF